MRRNISAQKDKRKRENLEDLIANNKILLSKKYTAGSVYMLEMPNNMLAVVAVGKDNLNLCSKSFFYTDKTKKETLKSSRKYFKQIQECLYQKKLEMLEELDLL